MSAKSLPKLGPCQSELFKSGACSKEARLIVRTTFGPFKLCPACAEQYRIGPYHAPVRLDPPEVRP